MTTKALLPGTLVVLEGLDRTGKSTQARALQRDLAPTSTSFAHMPRGLSRFTETTYELLESSDDGPASGVARQLAHLACHADSVPHLLRMLSSRAVVLDRWWWSSVAYGWYGGDIRALEVPFETYMSLVRSVWSPITASVVLLFDQPFEADANNSDAIRKGYEELAREHASLTLRMPTGSEATVTAHILDELEHRGLLTSE